MDIYVILSFISISSFFVFKYDFIRCIKVQTQQVMTSQITSHIEIFNTDLLYSFSYFMVKIDEKSSLTDGF